MDPGSRTKLLIIDDDVMLTTALCRHLQSDHHVTVVNDPYEALTLLRTGATFDVILCDLMMPQMTGIQLRHELLAFAPAQAAATILMTGGTISADARQQLEGIPNLAKPFSLDELRSFITAPRARA